MKELLDRTRRYLSFSKEEFLDIVISICIISFIFYFGKRGELDLLSIILIVTLSFLVHISAQKIIGYSVGYKAEYGIWWYGMLFSLMLIFVSRGTLWWVIVPGGITFSLMAGLRIGKFRYGLNYKSMGLIALTGSIASIVLATIFQQLNVWFFANNNVLFANIFVFNIAYAVSTMLPIPPLDGHYMFFGSRLWYMFLFGTIAAYSILAIVFSVYSWIFALVAGGLTWFIFYTTFERKLT